VPQRQRGVEATHGARHADRKAAGRGERKFHGFAGGGEHVGARRGRCAFARIDDEGLPGLGEVDQHEAAATDAGRLRLDHVQRELHRCSGVDGVASLRQQARAGGGRSRMRYRHHAVGRCRQHRG
jgi:hypothetical protein